MTFQNQSRSSATLHRRRQLLFKTALCAAPVASLVCFSPSQAATLSFSNFQGAFAPANWTFQGNGSGSFSTAPGQPPTPLTRMNISSPDGSPQSYRFNTSILNNYAPASTTPGKFYVFDGGKLDSFKASTNDLDYVIATVDSTFISFTLQPDLIAPIPGAAGRVSGFNYTANFREVPGPLPVAAAVGAFAWSRRIRRRLSSAAQA